MNFLYINLSFLDEGKLSMRGMSLKDRFIFFLIERKTNMVLRKVIRQLYELNVASVESLLISILADSDDSWDLAYKNIIVKTVLTKEDLNLDLDKMAFYTFKNYFEWIKSLNYEFSDEMILDLQINKLRLKNEFDFEFFKLANENRKK